MIVFITKITLSNRCLATIRGCLYRHGALSKEFVKYALEMETDDITYIPEFIQ
jgi:hypothetical protein